MIKTSNKDISEIVSHCKKSLSPLIPSFFTIGIIVIFFLKSIKNYKLFHRGKNEFVWVKSHLEMAKQFLQNLNKKVEGASLISKSFIFICSHFSERLASYLISVIFPFISICAGEAETEDARVSVLLSLPFFVLCRLVGIAISLLN